LQEIRVRHALNLLRTSDITIEAVALQCGYDSASHLSRHIKRATGKTPGSLRR
jgi:transcriptional regulator GlxA family with amidase domain